MLNSVDYQLIKTLKTTNPEVYNLIQRILDYTLQTASHGCHDLRNYVALISSYCQLLSMTKPEMANDPYFQKIELSTGNLINLFDEIALFRYSFNMEISSDEHISTLLTDAISYIKQTYTALNPNITIEFKDGSENLLYKCNPKYMHHTFCAFIKNSIEASQCKDININILVICEDSLLKIIIQDNGTGFSDEMLTTGCEPFTTDKKNHAGLGLALASTSIYKHNGNLELANTSNGSKITITFPLI